jgi:hypothetical protein
MRRHTVNLSAVIDVSKGHGAAALWIRADGQDGVLELINTAMMPVGNGDGASRREIEMDVPSKATKLLVGVSFKGQGSAHFGGIKVDVRALSGRSASTTPAETLAAAIDIARKNALHSPQIDWDTVIPEVKALAAGAQIAADAYPAVRLLLSRLGDRHSLFSNPYQSALMSSSGQQASKAEVKDLPGHLAYVRMPGYVGMDKEKAVAFSREIAGEIDKRPGSRGWIVDLRQDTGGNMWPMLAAMEPLLGTDKLGSFVSPAKTTPWFARAAFGRDQPAMADLSHVPVAVLIGPRTISSGEAVAVAFHGRPMTEFFGEPTGGRSTANGEFPLPDGSVLHLTVATDADRNGVTFGDRIAPDHVVLDAGNDEVLKAATDWLSGLTTH